jgi:acetate kinase
VTLALSPSVPQVAVFDTAFHQTMPAHAYHYALPERLYRNYRVRRYGFHGTSHHFVAKQAAEYLDRPLDSLNLITLHLGNGCSASAIQAGHCIDTSMGMTPLEGLMMGTRSGSIDPGILLQLLAGDRQDLTELADALQHRSGLLGVSGVSGDLREVERAAVGGEPRAALALEMFVRRAASAISAAATAQPRLDGVVFTGGIGAGAADVRAAICQRLSQLGVGELRQPVEGDVDAVVSEAGSRVPVLRIHAREDLVMAREVARLLA